MSNMPSTSSTDKAIFTLDPTPVPQPYLQAAQIETSSPITSKPEMTQIETSNPTTSSQPTPIPTHRPILTMEPTQSWNSGGWTTPNPTLSPVSYFGRVQE